MRFISSSVLFALLFGISSCQKEADPNAGSNSGSVAGTIKAKIDGVPWSSNKVTIASRFAGYISIGGISLDKKFISITLTDSGVHKYILSDETLNVAAYIDSTERQPFNFSSNQGEYPKKTGGVVTISAIDVAKKTISGTFSFKVFRILDSSQRTISEGSFTNLPYATEMPPSATTDTFKVKINGTPWTPHFVTALPYNGQLMVSATSSDGAKSVGILLSSNLAAGTYNFDSFASPVIGQYNPSTDPARSKLAVSGTATIIENNKSTKRIRGNFSFRGEEILEPNNFATLSEGYFSVKY